MSKKDYVDTLKTGLDIVGKMAAKGVTSISKGIRGDEREDMENRSTGLYFQRHILPAFGDLIPRIEYYESINQNQLTAGFVKKMIRSAADRSFVNACFAIIYGDFDTALISLAEALTADPQYTDCYFMQGSIYLMQRKFLRAEEAFSKCRLLPTGLGTKIRKFIPSFRLTICITECVSFTFYPDILALNLLLAISQRDGSKLPSAIATLEQILSVMPNSPELTFFLAALYYEALWDDKLIDLLKELVPADNMQILTVQFLVKAFIQKKNLSLAEGILQKSLEPENVDPYLQADLKMLLGEVAKGSGRVAEGTSYIQKVTQAYPNYQELTKRLGLARRNEPLAKHLVQDMTPQMPPMPVPPVYATAESASQPTSINLQEPMVAPGAMTVLTPAEMLPRELTGMEPGKIKLKSRDGKVDMILPDSISIGREVGDLVMSWDASASRSHARIFHDKGQIWVEDIGSSNGTWINQHRISDRRAFNKGDNLLIGKTEFYVE
jgi:tetratricopeptide (TPR) repeat protein